MSYRPTAAPITASGMRESLQSMISSGVNGVSGLTPLTYGSDSWYQWQDFLSKDSADKTDMVPCLYELIGISYDALSLLPTEEKADLALRAVATDKILLTSRSSYDRGSTARQLAEAGYTVKFGIGEPRPGLIYRCEPSSKLEKPDPCEPDDPSKLDPSNDKRRIVSYFEGLFMVDGLDKGKLLRSLLFRLSATYERVLLVDDGPKNLERMRDAMKAAGIEFVGLEYKGVTKYNWKDPMVTLDGINGREETTHFLRHISPEREVRLRGPDCFPR